ncbi:MAG: protein kinase domain-containing protein [Acidimicrobiales bacterium]
MSASDQTDLGVPGIGPGSLIGAGGTARVYRARQDALDRTIAVKILGPLDDAGRRRFDRERRAMGRLSAHRGIVTVYEAGVNSYGQSYVVMPLMEQGSLQDIVDRGLVEWPVAARLISDIAATIADAHDMSILHRDLKPGNVLVDDQGNPQVADFGLAHIVDSATAHKSTQLSFTPGYVPPETLEGLPATAAGDVYSLGATLFALLAGRAPFVSESADGNILALALRVRDEPVPDLRPRGVPDALCAVLEATMDKDPARRPTARELSARLAAIAAGDVAAPSAAAIATVPDATLPDAGRLVAAGAPAATGDAASVGTPLPIVPVGDGGGGSGRVFAAVGAVAAVIVAAILGFVVLGGGDGDPVADPGTDPADGGADAAGGGADGADGGDTAADGGDGAGDGGGAGDGDGIDGGGADGADGGDTAADGGDAAGADGADDAADGGGGAGDGADGGDGAGANDPAPDVNALEPFIETTLPLSIVPRFPLAADDGLFVVDPAQGIVARVDVRTGEETSIDVGERPSHVAASGGLLWVSNRGDDTVSVIDPASMTVIATLDAGAGVNAAAGDGTLLYAPNSSDGTVSVFDIATLAPVATIDVGEDPFTPSFFDGYVWVPNRGDDTVSIIDPATLAVVETVPVAAGPNRPEALFERLWIAGATSGEVTVFDPGSFVPAATVELGDDLRPPIAQGGLVWFVGVASERLWGVAPSSAALIHRIPLPSGSAPRAPRGAEGGVWVALAGLDQVRVFDPESGQVAHTIRDIGPAPGISEPVDGRIAVPSTTESSVSIIDPGRR